MGNRRLNELTNGEIAGIIREIFDCNSVSGIKKNAENITAEIKSGTGAESFTDTITFNYSEIKSDVFSPSVKDNQKLKQLLADKGCKPPAEL